MRKAIVLTSVLLMIGAVTADAAPGDTLWTRTYGGGDYQEGRCIEQTSDGGFIVAGSSTSYGPGWEAAYLLKLDADGDTVWTRTYGRDRAEKGYSVRETFDGGYVAAGYTNSTGSYNDAVYVIRTDSNGDTLWTSTIDVNGDVVPDKAFCIKQTADSNFILAGQSGYDDDREAILLKIDSNGNTLWDQEYDIQYLTNANYVQQTIDEGYIFAGGTKEDTSYSPDAFIIKTDTLGIVVWTTTVSGGAEGKRAYCVQQTDDGGYIAVGSMGTWSEEGTWITKFNSSGDSLWTAIYGSLDAGRSIKATPDGGYVITGNNYAGANSEEVFILKTAANGDSAWAFTYGGTEYDYAFCVDIADEGDYVIAGYTESFGPGWRNVYVLKINEEPYLTCTATTSTPDVPNINGTIIWNLHVTNNGVSTVPDVWGEIYPTVGDCGSGVQYDFNLTRHIVANLNPAETFTGRYWYRPELVTGVDLAAIWIYAGPSIDDYISGCCFEFYFCYEWGRDNNLPTWGHGEWGELGDEIVVPTTTALMQNYPNPFNATTTISFDIVQTGDVNLSIYNLTGQKIETLVDNHIQAGQHNISWDASTYSSGVYFYKLTTDGQTFTKRMTLLK